MKHSTTLLAGLSAGLLLAGYTTAHAAMDSGNSRVRTNITQKECTDLPTQQRTLTTEEFRRRTEYCSNMKGQTQGSATAGKDSASITAPGSSNPNAADSSYNTSSNDRYNNNNYDRSTDSNTGPSRY